MLWPVITSILEHIPNKSDELIETIKEKEKQIDELLKQTKNLEALRNENITSSPHYKEIVAERDQLRTKLEQTELEMLLYRDKNADLIARLSTQGLKKPKTASPSCNESNGSKDDPRFKLAEAEREILSCHDQIAELTAKLNYAERNAEKSKTENLAYKDQIKELIDAQETTRDLYREGLDQLKFVLSAPTVPLEGLLRRVNDGKLNDAFESQLRLININITADVESSKKNATDVYRVSLNGCECEDFKFRKQPCKHMVYLAYELGVLQINQNYCRRHFQPTIEKASNSATLLKSIENEKKELKKRAADLDKEQELLSNIDDIITKKCEGYPQLAAIMGDLLTVYYEKSALRLTAKTHPALKEAQRIRELRKETAAILSEKKQLEYKLDYLKRLYPNIEDVFDSGYTAEYSLELETEDDTDRTRLFLSHEEFTALSTTERNQLALDRYIDGRKSNWQIGRDYEMYIGYLYEDLGYRVQYTGILKKLEDMGRDLIATNKEETLIIQCKNWSKENVIHEKHIFQLFGTIVLYNIEHPNKPATGVFITSTSLSETAEKIANELNIKVAFRNPGNFPRIKCNINRQTGEKIYHLPFDQQYDSTVIDKSSGEFYAFTVREAEDKGFRRAFKHFSS